MSSVGLPQEVRAIFISDLHLGYRISRGDQCTDLFQDLRAQKIYLVGDIVDETRLSDHWYWPKSHQAALDAIVEQAKRGTQICFVPGNHDPCFRESNPLEKYSDNARLKNLLTPLLDFEIAGELVYQTKLGKRMLVVHGDLFDASDTGRLGAARRWGGRVFDLYNRWLPRQAITMIRAFFKLILARPRIARQGVCDYARKSGCDGVIFGHLHEPELVEEGGLIVGNCGDWVVNQSFLVETLDGRLQLFNRGMAIDQV